MNLPSHHLAILALLATSIVVRVLPVFLKLHLSDTVRGLLERVLPVAVFLNFAVYIIWSEMRSAPLAAGAAIIAVGILTLSTRAGLVLTTVLGTLIYAMVQLAL